jgi:hypothetical protein
MSTPLECKMEGVPPGLQSDALRDVLFRYFSNDGLKPGLNRD